MRETLALFALGATSVAMVIPPQLTAQTLNGNVFKFLRADKRIINGYMMVLEDNATESCPGGDKGGHRKLWPIAACSEVIDDSLRFSPRPLRQSGRACLDSPVRAALFYFRNARLAGWLLRMSYAFPIDERPQQSRLLM
jgi:hypothetical protein